MNFVGLIMPSNGVGQSNIIPKALSSSIIDKSENSYYKVVKDHDYGVIEVDETVSDTGIAKVYAAAAGDVAIDYHTKKEVLYTGTVWVEIGDTTAEAAAISALQELTEEHTTNIGTNTSNISTLQSTVQEYGTTIDDHGTTIGELQNLLTWQSF